MVDRRIVVTAILPDRRPIFAAGLQAADGPEDGEHGGYRIEYCNGAILISASKADQVVPASEQS